MSVIEGLLFLTEYWPFSRSAQETVVARFPIFKAGSEPLYWEQRARCLNRLASLQVIATCYGNILFYIYIYISLSLSIIIEGSLEVKLPTIWTDEEQRWEESEKRREEKKKENQK